MRKSVINLTNEIISIGTKRGIGQLVTEDHHYDGRHITIRGKRLLNFGSYSYLGLELDRRLKDAAIDAIERYGMQFPSSRTYVSNTLYTELEELMELIFDAPILLATSTTIGHQAVMPVVVEEGDAIIMDQQVHSSVQDVAMKMQLKGVPVTVVRHNKLDDLEDKIASLYPQNDRIWYMIDGIYSMYGDCAPLKEIVALLDKYPWLHLYVDDAHGMSWAGENGAGYVLSQVDLHPRMILASSLNKAFAAGGAVFAIPDKELRDKVKRCGGPLIFAGQHQTSALAASIACANIHLSPEITHKQADLKQKVEYCGKLLREYGLPHIEDSVSPIFFVGVGLTKVGYNLVKRMIEEDCYVNLAVFPAVPESCTGVRFTITCHLTMEDIEKLVLLLAFHHQEALKEEGRTLDDIKRAFRKVPNFIVPQTLQDTKPAPKKKQEFTIRHETSITKVPKNIWDKRLGSNGLFDWDGLKFLEEVYSNNENAEHNCDFHYFMLFDEKQDLVLATFASTALIKDDMLAAAGISQQVEQERLKNPYYLTSSALMLGSVLTEGNHIYINKKHPNWKGAYNVLVDELWKLQETTGTNSLFLRDFQENDRQSREFFFDQGFVKVELPETNVVESIKWSDKNSYLAALNSKKRGKLKKEVLPYEDYFDVEVVSGGSTKQVDHWYNLFCNVKERSLKLNDFTHPKKLFKLAVTHPNFEVIELYLKDGLDNDAEGKPVAMVLCYKNANYIPVLVGMDYEYNAQFNVYQQAIFQVVLRATELRSRKIHFGLTAGQTKRKFGATSIRQVAYLQMKDNHSVALLNTMTERPLQVV